MTSNLNTRTVVCQDDLVTGAHCRTPSPVYFANIPLLWQMLELTVGDWQRELRPYQECVDAAPESAVLAEAMRGFAELQPYFLKTLFSYAVFVVSLEGAYKRFYSDLNGLNKVPSLRVSHGTPPQRTPFLNKVRLIRNVAIAHIGSHKVSAATSIAASSWQPMSLVTPIGSRPNLDRLTFGGMRTVITTDNGAKIQSQDLEVEGVSELDRQCREYLTKYDQMCVEYLDAIHRRLPVDVGSVRYSSCRSSGQSPSAS